MPVCGPDAIKANTLHKINVDQPLSFLGGTNSGFTDDE
jgi:hypothetical protein